MRVQDARVELEQYIETREFDCPGSQWGYYNRIDRTWTPTWGPWRRIIKTSLQLCIPEHETFPTPQAYAAQVNWGRKIKRALAKEPTWRTDAWPTPVYNPKPHYPQLPAEHSLGVKYVAALRATGDGWERDVLKATWRPRKRARKGAAA